MGGGAKKVYRRMISFCLSVLLIWSLFPVLPETPLALAAESQASLELVEEGLNLGTPVDTWIEETDASTNSREGEYSEKPGIEASDTLDHYTDSSQPYELEGEPQDQEWSVTTQSSIDWSIHTWTSSTQFGTENSSFYSGEDVYACWELLDSSGNPLYLDGYSMYVNYTDSGSTGGVSEGGRFKQRSYLQVDTDYREPGTYSVIVKITLEDSGGNRYVKSSSVSYILNQAPKYTIRFDANGGPGAPTSQTKLHDVPLTLSDVEPTKPGYVFVCWAKAKDTPATSYTGISDERGHYRPGSWFRTDEDTTLYAVWKARLEITDWIGTYDGGSHSLTCSVSGPTNYTLYYSTQTKLSVNNYAVYGSTTRPTISYGSAGVYIFLLDKDNPSSSIDGFGRIVIKPRITSTDYVGVYDGKIHSPSVTYSEGSTIYYWIDGAVSDYDLALMINDGDFSNLSQTIPGIAEVGTLRIRYLVMPLKTTQWDAKELRIIRNSAVLANLNGEDFDLFSKIENSKAPVAIGTASVTIGESTVKSIVSCTMTLSPSSYTYDGTQKTPTLTVKDGSKTLAVGTDYEVTTTPSGRANAGTYTYTVTGKGNYKDTKSASFTIAAKSLSGCTATLSPSSYTYDGTQKTPTLTVKDGSKTLAVGTDYEVTTTPSGRTNAGTYTYTVTGKGNYKDTKSASFTITSASKTLTRDDLRYSFSNGYSDFGYSEDSEIELASYKLVYGNAKAEALYSYNHNRGSKWRGSCYGMSTTSSMFNVDGSGFAIKDFRSSANRLSELKTTDISRGYVLRNYIEAMQVSHSDSVGSNQYYNSSRTLGTAAALNRLCEAVESSAKLGKPVVIEFFWCEGKDSSENPIWGGHAVVAYALEKVSATQKRLRIYDPNFPNSDRSFILSTNSQGSCTGWYYKMNDLINCGSSYNYYGSGCWISHIPYDVFESFWLGGSSMKNRNTLMTNATDFVVKNVSGNVVGKVEGGILTETDSSITQVFTCDDGSELAGTTLLMPSDATYTLQSLKDQNNNTLQASMLNEEQAASVITDASEITFTVDDAEEVNLVDVSADSGETYQVSLNSDLSSASGRENIELSGVGNGTRLSFGTISGSCIVVNGRSAVLTVNGEAVDIGSRVGIVEKDASLEYATCTYDGKAKEPKVTVKHGGTSLIEERDFVVKYSNNVEPGTATATIYGIGDYDGKVELPFVIKRSQTVIAPSKITVAMGRTASIGARTSSDGKLTYKSSNNSIVKVSATGLVTPVNVGKATVTITATATNNYKSASKTVTITVTQGAQVITASDKSVQVKKTMSLGAKTSGNGKLTYKSSNTSVATVNASGVVTGKKAGTAKVTILAAGTTNYKSVTKTVTVTVKNANTMTAKVKKATVTVSLKTLKSKTVTLTSNIKVSSAKGKVTYTNASSNATAKKFKVNAKNGKVNVLKGTKKGKYQVKVKVTANGDKTHMSGSKTVSYYVRLK